MKKTVKPFGKGGHVVLPKDLVGKEIYITTEKQQEDIYQEPETQHGYIPDNPANESTVQTQRPQATDEAEKDFITRIKSTDGIRRADLINKAYDQFGRDRTKELVELAVKSSK